MLSKTVEREERQKQEQRTSRNIVLGVSPCLCCWMAAWCSVLCGGAVKTAGVRQRTSCILCDLRRDASGGHGGHGDGVPLCTVYLSVRQVAGLFGALCARLLLRLRHTGLHTEQHRPTRRCPPLVPPPARCKLQTAMRKEATQETSGTQ